ncbi:hypothetical protein L345_11148, partial [Ophiophagus hannah]
MEVAGNGVGPFHLGPLTSTPIESSTSSLPTRVSGVADSLSSENSDSSGEDWLIKVRCPGARHRYSKRAHEKKEVDRYLKHNDFLALRRREMLYKKWFESVSRPLLQKIQDKVDNQSSKEIEERKRKQLSHYLNYCNEKLSPTELVSSPNALSSLPKSAVPPTSSPVLQSSAPSAMDRSSASQNPPDSEPKYDCDFSAYHSHNPFFLPVLPPIQSQRSLLDWTCEGLAWVRYFKRKGGKYLTDSLPNEEEKAFLLYALQLSTGKVYSSKDIHELHKTELPPLPLGRQLINPIEWLKIPFQYMESDVRKKCR